MQQILWEREDEYDIDSALPKLPNWTGLFRRFPGGGDPKMNLEEKIGVRGGRGDTADAFERERV